MVGIPPPNHPTRPAEARRSIAALAGVASLPAAWADRVALSRTAEGRRAAGGIAAAAWAARRPFGLAAAAAAAAIVALDPFVATYAIEVRMYTLLLLCGLLATGAFLRAFVVHPGHRGWAGALAVALAAILYTHNW